MTEMTREQIVEAKCQIAFSEYRSKIAQAFIAAGDGARVPQVHARIDYDTFSAGWKAALESVEIELPPRRKTNHANTEANAEAHGFNDGVEACHDIWVAQGVKVKS